MGYKDYYSSKKISWDEYYRVRKEEIDKITYTNPELITKRDILDKIAMHIKLFSDIKNGLKILANTIVSTLIKRGNRILIVESFEKDIDILSKFGNTSKEWQTHIIANSNLIKKDWYNDLIFEVE